MQFIWNSVARVLARPAVVGYLIRRATRTPYTHIVTDGLLYMERYWLFNPYQPESSGAKNWFPISIRLHHIRLPDQDRHLHDHPWNARTFILRGGYRETRPAMYGPMGILYDREPGDTCKLRYGEYHRIVSVKPDTWTLFITGRYQGTWGFLVNGVKVQWRTYLGLDKAA